jgi:type III restriction enzyme
MLMLKNYQKATIEATSSFLEDVLLHGAEKAFIERKASPGLATPVYRTNGLGDIPYFCLRIPTGGGKTLVASHLLRTVAHDYLMKPKMMVLWLVPTTIIMNQTLKSLINTEHPYRIAN